MRIEPWIIPLVDSYHIHKVSPYTYIVWYTTNDQFFRASGTTQEIRKKITDNLRSIYGNGYYQANHCVNEINPLRITTATTLSSKQAARELVEELNENCIVT